MEFANTSRDLMHTQPSNDHWSNLSLQKLEVPEQGNSSSVSHTWERLACIEQEVSHSPDGIRHSEFFGDVFEMPVNVNSFLHKLEYRYGIFGSDGV